MHDTDDTSVIIGLEHAAMVRWAQGDPSGFIEITAEDVSYFDPFQPARIDSRAGLERLYESLRGQVHLERWEFHEPRVQFFGDTAILTFEFLSSESQFPRWRTTEVYHRTPEGWRIKHTHWALPAPPTA